MIRCVLKYKGSAPDIEIRGKLQSLLAQVTVIDSSNLPFSGLIEVDESRLPEIKSRYGGDWDFFPEITYRVPDTRQKIKK